MKILFLTPNRRGLVCIDFWSDLEEAMGKFAECKWAGNGYKDYINGEKVEQTVKRLYGDDYPDWVIIFPTSSIDGDKWKNFRNRTYPYKIAAVTSDIHASRVLQVGTEGLVAYFRRAKFNAILMLYDKIGYGKHPYHRINPNCFLNLESKICFSPPCINPDVFRPSKKSKIYDVVFLGAVDKRQHPLRYAVWNKLPRFARKKGWKILLKGRPDGRVRQRVIKQMIKHNYVVGEKYVEVLGRSKIFIFDSSIYKYPLLKYFEGMACGTCVMADVPFRADKLHFIPNKNFIEVNLGNWKQKLEYYLRNNVERERITECGYQTVLKYHTCETRARKLVKWLEENI